MRSAHNVGAIFRSADAFGVSKIILTGITPYPKTENDARLPHVSDKAQQMIAKTALGAENSVPFEYIKDPVQAIIKLKTAGYKIYALEQTEQSVGISVFKPQFPCALVVGSEVAGVSRTLLDISDEVLEIPMQGRKESLNVAVAAGIALYQLSQTSRKAKPQTTQ